MRIRALALLGILAGVCLLLLTLQMRGHASGASDALAIFTTPVQTVVSRVNRTAFGLWSTGRRQAGILVNVHSVLMGLPGSPAAREWRPFPAAR